MAFSFGSIACRSLQTGCLLSDHMAERQQRVVVNLFVEPVKPRSLPVHGLCTQLDP